MASTEGRDVICLHVIGFFFLSYRLLFSVFLTVCVCVYASVLEFCITPGFAALHGAVLLLTTSYNHTTTFVATHVNKCRQSSGKLKIPYNDSNVFRRRAEQKMMRRAG